MANETGKNPQQDRHNSSQTPQSQQPQGNQANQSAKTNQDANKGSSGSHSKDHSDRSGVRTDVGTSMTEMGGREHRTNANSGSARGDMSNERNVTAHNDTGERPGEQSEQNRNANDQQHRKAS